MNWKQGTAIVMGVALVFVLHFLPWPRSRPALVSTQTKPDGTVIRTYKAPPANGELISEGVAVLLTVAVVSRFGTKRSPDNRR